MKEDIGSLLLKVTEPVYQAMVWNQILDFFTGDTDAAKVTQEQMSQA